jgi:maleylpyruvate isomerase
VKPADDIAGCAASHQVLRERIASLNDHDVRQPSLLPDWSVAHVLTHLARNAESHVHRLEACARGEKVHQYPGGAEGRAAAIEAGADRPAVQLIADVGATIDAFHSACEAMPDDAWANISWDVGGLERTAETLPLRRWQEVEVHHVDLGLGYTHRDWPDAFVARRLPSMREQLPGRLPAGVAVPDFEGLDDREILAWLYDRVVIDGLPPLGAWA